jgi:Flp pilus assembly protein TadD
VVHSAFWFMDHLWGANTFAYHVVNVSLHALSAFLIVLVLRRLDIPGAVLAATVFLLHPLQVESVAWISELKNVLSTAFYLAALLAYLSFDARRTAATYAAAFALFAVAVFSKTVTASLPAALLVVFWWQRGRVTWSTDVRPLVPFFGVSLAGGAITAWVEYALIGAQGAFYDFGPIARVLIAGRVVWFYVAKLVWPANLAFMYPRWGIDAQVWWQYLYPVALVAALVVLWQWRTRDRGPLATALLFVGSLAPALGFVNVYPFRFAFVADHFQYLAGIAIIAAIAAGAVGWLGTLGLASVRVQTVLVVATGIPLGVISWQLSHQYADNRTLFLSTLARNPTCWMCHHNLADMETEAGNQTAALDHFETALRLSPSNPVIHHDLAIAYMQFGREADALREFRTTINLDPMGVGARQDYGEALRKAGRISEATDEFAEAVRLAPNSPMAHAELGVSLLDQGRLDRAMEHLREAVQLDPAAGNLRAMLASALRAAGRMNEAIEQDRGAVRLEPGSAAYYNNLATDLVEAGKGSEGIAAFRAALDRDPTNTRVRLNLGIALAMARRPEDAESEFREILRREPENPLATSALERLARERGPAQK